MTFDFRAYPHAGVPTQKGMTMRDHFAGQALSGLLASPANQIQDAEQIRVLAELSYDFADAMLAARSTNANNAE